MSWKIFGVRYSAEEVMQAHQFLYYVGPAPAWTGYQYGKWCESMGLDGGGGSDRESSYASKVKALAMLIYDHPSAYSPEWFTKETAR